MRSHRTEKEILNEVLRTLASLKGVKHVFRLSDKVRSELKKIEQTYPFAGPVPVRNQGLLECLGKRHVACIIKDKAFRPAPRPTVVLTDADGNTIGWELLPGHELKKESGKKYLFLGKDFVICHDGRSGRNAHFLLPPIPFPEVEQIEGVVHVCSSSPTAIGDVYLKKGAGLKDDPKLASILIGFDILSGGQER